MEQENKYYDIKNLLDSGKEKITVNIPKFIYDDLKAFEELTNLNTTDIVKSALFDFFRYKTVTNDYLLGYGDLYFELPLSMEFKENAIANKIKLNQDLGATAEPSEQIIISTVTNNLDVFNGVTFTANKELQKKGIKHCGVDFVIIPSAIEPVEQINFNQFNINLLDCLYVFYYEVTSINTIDVFLINPVEAVNRLSSVNASKMNDYLISCLQDLKMFQSEINNKYVDELEQLHKNNNYVSNDKERAIIDKYNMIFSDALNDIAIKYKNDKIKMGSDMLEYNLNRVRSNINQFEDEHERMQRVMSLLNKQEKEQK